MKIAQYAALMACVWGADDVEDGVNLLQTELTRKKLDPLNCDGPHCLVGGTCPFKGVLFDDVPVGEAVMAAHPLATEKVPKRKAYAKALKDLDIAAVEKDIKALMHQNYSYWPNNADWDHYGPFFIRLAWHCSGPFRATDGKGGCAGGRLRFEPERSWDDNTNLDKARTLVYPIKRKYGDGLSWGDLYVAAGTLAIQEMGGPTKPMCFGRPDDANGKKSVPLNKPCRDPNGKKLKDGTCKSPWGQTTHGLIYVNPGGPEGHPADPEASAHDIEDAFGRMGMNAYETVALIGGGHAFGKTHGACSDTGAGRNPEESLQMRDCGIWEGTCGGDGRGSNTVTSGFEGAWTTTPTKWSNEFFRALVGEEWVKYTAAGGNTQWQTKNRKSKYAGVTRLTSDMALLHSPVYKNIVSMFAADQGALESAFAHAWAQLTEAGTQWSPARKCQEIPTMQTRSIPPQTRPMGWAAWMPEPLYTR